VTKLYRTSQRRAKRAAVIVAQAKQPPKVKQLPRRVVVRILGRYGGA